MKKFLLSTFLLSTPAYASVQMAPPPEAQSLLDRFFAANPGYMGGPNSPVPCQWLPQIFTFIVDWGNNNPLVTLSVEPPPVIDTPPPIIDIVVPPPCVINCGSPPPCIVMCDGPPPPVTPIPEPSTWAMLIMGFVGLSIVGWRKKYAIIA